VFAQNFAGSRVHVMHLVTDRTGHRLIDVLILRGIFGRKALNEASGFWAAVNEERHVAMSVMPVIKVFETASGAD
jgi:hypothetical protein